MAAGGGNLGSIRGKIVIDYDGAGIARAKKDTDDLGKKAGESGKSWDKASKLMLGAGLAIAGGFALSVKSAADFEQGLANIRAVTGATTSDIEAVRKKALQLGADTKFSAGEAAGAIEELAKAGISLPDILNGAADATVALAAAGDIALPEAATIASNAMNQFGLSAKQLPKVADLIAGAANASAIDVRQFGFSLAQVGAVAHLAGITFDDTATAIALLGNAGIVGSDAGTSLKSVFQNLIPTTKQQINLAKELGIITKDGSNQFFDAAGNAKSLAEVSQVLQNATKNLTKEQKLAALSTLFGSDAIRGAAILADNGADGFNKMADAMGKVKAADVAATKMDTLKGKIEAMKGSLETAGIVIGTQLIPPLTKLVNYVTSLVNAFGNLSPQTQKTIITILGIAAAVLIFVGVVYKVIQVIKAFQVVWLALNVSFLATPLGLIILAIVALVAVFVILWIKCAWFRNFWIGTWNVIWAVLKAIGSWFAGPFKDFFVNTWNAIWGFFKAIGAWFAGPFANFFVSLWHIITTVFNGIWAVIKFVWDVIATAFMAVWNVISTVIGFFAPIFEATFGLIVSIIKLAWAVISAIIQVGITIWGAIIGAVLGFIVDRWNATWNFVSAVIQAVWGFIGPYVIGAITFIHDGIVSTVNNIVNAWNAAWGFIAGIVLAVWQFIGPYVMTAVNFVKDVISAAWNWVVGVTSAAWNFIWGIISSVVSGIESFLSAAWDFIVNVFLSARDRIVAVINGIRAIVDKIRGFFNDLKNAAAGGTDSLIAFVKNIPSRIFGAIGNIGATLVQKGRDLIQGLINGIKNMAGALRNALVSLLPGPLKDFAGQLGLASPSKLFEKWGVFTVQGFINGVAAMRAHLADAMASMANVATSPGGFDVGGGTGGSAAISAASTSASNPTVNVAAPAVLVVADFGSAGRQLVRHTISDEPELVASAANAGNDYNGFKSGRPS